MKKNTKLYVSRYVPYSIRVRERTILMLKTAAATFTVCIALIFTMVFAADDISKKISFSIAKSHGAEVEASSTNSESTKKALLNPVPDADTRAKADRLREINFEYWNEHNYLPSEQELGNVYVNDNKKVCYLTFDDGPSGVTPQILDILAQYKVKATFFVTGETASENKGIVKDIYNRGHTIGNHSYSHVYNAVYESYESFLSEVSSCKDAINNALGFEYKNLVFRFPGGFSALNDEKTKKDYIRALSNQGYKYIDWSCLTGDSNITDPTPEYLMNTLKSGIGNSRTGDIVVLMHDSPTKQVTAETLPAIIEYLYESGYKFDVLKNK